MGMFFNFDDNPLCNWCEQPVWKCECGKGPKMPSEPIVYSDTEPKVTKGDIICKWEDGKAYDQAYVSKIRYGKPIVIYLDNQMDGCEVEWLGGEYRKLCHALVLD